MSSTYQLFVYKVKNAGAAQTARQDAITAWSESAGYIDWTPLKQAENASGEGTVFADVVEWASPEACANGNKMFGEDARIAPFREQIAELISGGEYLPS